MLFGDFVETFISSGGEPDPVRIKAALLSAVNSPIELNCEEQFPALLTAAVNISFGKPKSRQEFMDMELARDLFARNVLEKLSNGKWAWLTIIEHMGTHQPKTHNDKISSGAVVAHFTSDRCPDNTVSSSDCIDGSPFSGAGNGANNAHYLLLAMTLSINGETGALIEWISRDAPAVQKGFCQLGLNDDAWDTLVKKSRTVMACTNTSPIDRQLKQIALPCREAPNGYWLLSPVPSTRLISAFEHKRRQMHNQGIQLTLTTTQVGGTKVQNAGSLANELKGQLRHLSMEFPTSSPHALKQRLFAVSRGCIFSGPRKDEASETLSAWFTMGWQPQTIPRQQYRDMIRRHLNQWLTPRLDELVELSDYIAEQYDHESGKSLLDTPEYDQIPRWLRSFLDPRASAPVAASTIRKELTRQALMVLESTLAAVDDRHMHLLYQELETLIMEATG